MKLSSPLVFTQISLAKVYTHSLGDLIYPYGFTYCLYAEMTLPVARIMVCNKHNVSAASNSKQFESLLVTWGSANLGWAWLGGQSPPGTHEACEYSSHGNGGGVREQAQWCWHISVLWSCYACKYSVSSKKSHG